MSGVAGTGDRPGYASRPALRLLSGTGEAAAEAGRASRPALRLVQEGPRILIAGGDAERRAVVRRELAGALAPGTLFGEAGRVWEVLQQAHTSGVVMLEGDLEDASVQALTHLLGQRHPRLPIVVMDAPAAEASPARALSGVSDGAQAALPGPLPRA